MRQKTMFDNMTMCYVEVHDPVDPSIQYTDSFCKFVARVRFIIGTLNDNVSPPVYGKVVFPRDENEWISYISRVAIHFDTHRYVDRNTRQIVESIRKSVFKCNPVMGQMLEELILKLSFSPSNVRKTEVSGVVSFAKSGLYSDPGVSADVIAVLAVVDSKFPLYTFPSMSGLVYDYEIGMSNRYMAGNSHIGYLNTLNKMGANIVAPRLSDSLKLLCYVADGLIYRMGVYTAEPRQLNFSKSHIYNMLRDLDSSSGWFNDDIYRYSKKGVTKILKCKKKNLASQMHKLIDRLFRESEEYVRTKVSPPNWNMFAQEARKWEFRTLNMLTQKLTKEEARRNLMKERLFYIDNMVAYVLGKEYFQDLAFLLCGYQMMIGIKVEAGGLQILWDQLTGGPSSVYKQLWDPVISEVKDTYGVDLTDRVYVTGDFEKFDQTLLAQVLAVVAALVIPFVSKPDGMSDECFRYITTVVLTEVVYKTMYIYSNDSLYDVWGSMFSGKYITSSGDSAYQMMLRPIHLLLVYFRHAKHNVVVKRILENQMVVDAFYGDDNVASYPRYLDCACYYDDSDNFAVDFVNFCEREFGLVSKKHEFAIFDECYSTHCFTTIDGCVLLDAFYQGPTFIRNAVSHIYLDGVFIADLPYRSTEDIMSKVARVLTASQSMSLTMCLVASLARLSSGNFEAYDQLSKIYDEFFMVNGPVSFDDWERFRNMKGQNNSVSRMLKGMDEYPGRDLFPRLIDLHLVQFEGYSDMTGLCPVKDGAYYNNESLFTNTGRGFSLKYTSSNPDPIKVVRL